MAGFTGLDQIINAVTNNPWNQQLEFTKRLPSTTVASVPHTAWLATGNPVAGTTPTVGLGGAVVTTSATDGAMPYTNPGGARTMHLVSGHAMSMNAIGSLLLVDRIAHANITNNQGTGNFTPNLDATSRLGATEGALIFMEVTTALSAAANTRTFTYTNQAGTAGRVTQNVVTVASAVAGRVPYANYVWVQLQAGDTGVRSIQSTTLVSGTATGNYNVVLVRPLGYPFECIATSLGSDHDFVLDLPSLDRIYPDSCLMWIWLPVAAAIANFAGMIRVVEN